MALASTCNDLRESLIAQRIVRVQPLSGEVCRWMANQKPFSPPDQILLLGNLVEQIASANQKNNPYLTLCSIASALPFYQQRVAEDQARSLPGVLTSLCGLVSLSHLRVVIEEEWSVLAEAAQRQAFSPTHFASEYLTMEYSAWCRHLVQRSLSLLGDRFSKISADVVFHIDGNDWERSFRLAESLVFAPHELKTHATLKKFEARQKSTLLALVERAQNAMSLERREYSPKETSPIIGELPVDESKRGRATRSDLSSSSLREAIPTVATPIVVSDVKDYYKSGSSSSGVQLTESLPEVSSPAGVPATSTHPAIEEYFATVDDVGFREMLESVLNEARSLEVPVNLAIVRELKVCETLINLRDKPLEIQKSPNRVWLQQVCDDLSQTQDECEFFKLISIRSGELIYVQGGGERLNLMPWIRSVLAGSLPLLATEVVAVDDEVEPIPNGLVAGLASVGRPNKSFRSTALLQAALRCLEAAKRQGAGAIKSIEVY